MLEKRILIYISVVLFLSSCFKKENAITLPAGNSEITSLFLGDNYENEVYFDLGTNSYVQKQHNDWDMRFESSDNGWGIFINTSSSIKVRRLDLYHLSEPKSFDTAAIKELPELLESPNGKDENSPFKDWKNYYQGNGASRIFGIYVVELNYLTDYKRFKRMQIESVNDTAFICTITDLYDAAGDSILFNNNKTVIKKDKNQNFTYLSFKGYTHIVLDQEPGKENWDFVFTQYQHLFPNILPNGALFPYTVTGVLSNRNKVLVAKDSLKNFSDIDGVNIPDYTFSSDANMIGYDWKMHAFGAGGSYTVNSQITYLIKDTEGYYYKMRFLDFYNEKAEKGYPKFEFVRIK